MSSDELTVGDEVAVDVGPIAHGGHCVARHEGRVIFVRHTIPGERVRARITEGGEGDRFLRADAVEILTESEHRVPVRFSALLSGVSKLLRDPVFMGLTFVGGFGMASFFVFLASASFVYTGHYGLTPTGFSLAFAANAAGFFTATQLALLRDGMQRGLDRKPAELARASRDEHARNGAPRRPVHDTRRRQDGHHAGLPGCLVCRLHG